MNTQPFHDISDSELLEKFYNDHDNRWLGILLPRYTLVLLGVCMKYLKHEDDAKDAVQQIFLKVISELHKYKVEYFRSWVFMVAKNHCLMKFRDKSRHSLEINDDLALATESMDVNELLEKNRSLDQLHLALETLNNDQQLCIRMFYFEKQSYTDISAVTGFSAMQVKSYIQNGKRNLKLYLESKK